MIENMVTTIIWAVKPLSHALLHSLWQAALVAVLLGVTLAFLRRGSAALRYGLSCLALAIVAVSFAGTAVHLGRSSLTPTAAAVSAANEGSIAVAQATVSNTAAESSSVKSGVMGVFLPESAESIAPMFFQAWVAGVLLLSLYHLMGWRRSRRLVNKGVSPAPPEWQKRVDRMCQTLKMSTPVLLMRSVVVKAPCVIGWIRPVVLFPASAFSGLTPDQLELILVHELAHIRRLDVLVNYCQTALETVFFFNPATWWISRQIRIEREHCCDDLAVEIGGDSLRYARALVDLEGVRAETPSLALAASGGSLVSRIRRLADKNNRPSGRRTAGLAGVAVFAVALTMSIGAIGGISPETAMAGPDSQKAGQYEEQDDDYHGNWHVRTDHRKPRIVVEFPEMGESRSFEIHTEKWEEHVVETEGGFQINYDAGTFFFEGEAPGRRWSDSDDDGRVHYRARTEYTEELEELGYRKINRDRLFDLGIHGVRLEFLRGIAASGYEGIKVEELITLHIHGVTPEYIDELGELGYNRLRFERLVEFKIHDVEPEYIEDLNELGLRNIDASTLLEMSIHDVRINFIEELNRSGYRRLSPKTLIEMGIHGVDLDLLRRLGQLGYGDLDPKTLVTMKIHDVSPTYITDLADLGYEDIDPDDLVTMHIHDVSPRFIRKLAELGYEDVDIDDLVSMKIHDVTPAFIERMNDRSRGKLSPRKLVEIKNEGAWSRYRH